MNKINFCYNVNFIRQQIQYVIKDEKNIGLSTKRLTTVLVDLHLFDRQYIKLKLIIIKLKLLNELLLFKQLKLKLFFCAGIFYNFKQLIAVI